MDEPHMMRAWNQPGHQGDRRGEPPYGPRPGYGAQAGYGAPDRYDAQGRGAPHAADLGALLGQVARGDQAAFERVYAMVSGPVYGLVLRVVRDPAQSEEVAQEVLVEVWRSASRYDPERGSGMGWIMTLAHRRAVDRVRSAQASADRETRAGMYGAGPGADHDQVAEQVEARLEREQVRRCLGSLTDLQRESVTLAYYGGYTYREVAELLGMSLGTVKTRMRDGLIRMRDCLGVE